MTRSVTEPNRVAKWGAYAHFPGTGPEGKMCQTCDLVTTTGEKHKFRYYCLKYKQLLGVKRFKITEAIQPHTAACKYYKEKK